MKTTSSPQRLTCPHCTATSSVPEGTPPGKKCKCPKCGGVFRTPENQRLAPQPEAANDRLRSPVKTAINRDPALVWILAGFACTVAVAVLVLAISWAFSDSPGHDDVAAMIRPLPHADAPAVEQPAADSGVTANTNDIPFSASFLSCALFITLVACCSAYPMAKPSEVTRFCFWVGVAALPVLGVALLLVETDEPDPTLLPFFFAFASAWGIWIPTYMMFFADWKRDREDARKRKEKKHPSSGELRCPYCSTLIHQNIVYAGQDVACPGCHAIVEAPGHSLKQSSETHFWIWFIVVSALGFFLLPEELWPHWLSGVIIGSIISLIVKIERNTRRQRE